MGFAQKHSMEDGFHVHPDWNDLVTLLKSTQEHTFCIDGAILYNDIYLKQIEEGLTRKNSRHIYMQCVEEAVRQADRELAYHYRTPRYQALCDEKVFNQYSAWYEVLEFKRELMQHVHHLLRTVKPPLEVELSLLQIDKRNVTLVLRYKQSE
jgi:hypothetical protein